MLMLTLFVSTAMADLTQNYFLNSNFWANTDNYPTELEAVIDGATASNGTAIKKDGATVQMASNTITVTEDGNVTVTFTHSGGQHMLNIMGVDVIDANGTVVKSDYHYGSAGGNLINNVYTLEGLTAGTELTLRCFVYDNTGTGDRTNNAQGWYVVTNVTGEPISVVKRAVNLDNGLYIIREVNGDVALYDGSAIARGALAADAGNDNYVFYINKGSNGYYTIQTADYKFVTYSGTGNGTALSTSNAEEANDDNKWWAIREGNASGLRIIVPKTNDVFDAPGWNYAINLNGKGANTGVGLWNSSGNNSQWYITKAPVMSEGLANLKIANVLAYSDGTNIVKAATENSIFKFTRGENGCYTIQATDGKYLIYTSTSNHLLTVVDGADANDENKWWSVVFDMANRDASFDILPKQNNIGKETPALNWSQDTNSKLGFWSANDGNSYCSMEWIVTPEVGSFIAFQSAATSAYCAGKYVKTVPVVTSYTGQGYAADRDHTQLVFDNCDPATTPSAVFEVIAGATPYDFKLKNVHTQEYVVSFVKGAQHMGAEENAVAISFKGLGRGQVAVYGANNGNPMHAQDAYSVIVTWNTAAYGASAWNLVEVETPVHTLTVGAAGYTTLVLGYNAIVPAIEGEGNGVFTAKVDGEWIDLTAVAAGSVLPANTAVIIKAAANTELQFAYSAETAAEVTTDLSGTLYDNNVAPGEGNAAYVLSNVEGVVGFYKATLNQVENTAFKNNANKAYLVVDGADLAAYSFRFPGTTGVENVEVENVVKTIYDLTGRRVEAITAPGIFIVNGKKTLVK